MWYSSILVNILCPKNKQTRITLDEFHYSFSFAFNRSKGNLRAFPMNVDGPIKTFAEFNNNNCRNGYLYFNQKDDLRISVMPSKRMLDTPWPLQKIHFKQTSRIKLNDLI